MINPGDQSRQGTTPPGSAEGTDAKGLLRAAARWATGGALFAAITLTVFFLLEGAASTILFARYLWQEQEGVQITEEVHTRYDPQIGWVSLPNVRIPDMYGPGKGLTTNDRGFRGQEDVGPDPPDGRRRVICSGDSFTLGHGVADDATWCAGLGALDGTLQTVNVGQGGYGIDQAYLWYRRDASDLVRSVHVFAFIGDDFFRMQSDHFLGYGKPVLDVVDGALVVTNVPVPERGRVARWLAQNGRLFAELRSIRLLTSVVGRFGGGAEPGGSGLEATWEVAAAIFDDLAAENAARGAQFVLVFLPTPWDYDTELYDAWRARVRAYATDSGTLLIDLVDEIRALEAGEARDLFIPDGEIGAPHLNEQGNAWVARRIYDSMPALYARDSAAPLR